MSGDLLIHATLTVSGDAAALPAADARIKTLLVEEVFEGGFEEHHGSAALSYDFMVRGGIPFPAFALASQEFPQLAISAEWVNMAAGRKGRARIAGGRIVEHAEEAMDLRVAATPQRYLRAAADGRLLLAFALLRRGPSEWAGYALRHDRDALFHLLRTGEGIELRATEGEPEWSVVWRLKTEQDSPPARPCMRVAVDGDLYAGLERMAREFVAEWIWMQDAPEAEIAIEREHHARYGYAVAAANVRAAKLKAMAAGDGGVPVHDTLDPADGWIRDLLLRCWAAQ